MFPFFVCFSSISSGQVLLRQRSRYMFHRESQYNITHVFSGRSDICIHRESLNICIDRRAVKIKLESNTFVASNQCGFQGTLFRQKVCWSITNILFHGHETGDQRSEIRLSDAWWEHNQRHRLDVRQVLTGKPLFWWIVRWSRINRGGIEVFPNIFSYKKLVPSHWDRSYHRTDTKCLLTFSPLSNAVTMFTLGQVYFVVHFPTKSSLNLTLPDSHPGPK